jgi:hypothetical protein
VRIMLDRDEDMLITGHRHSFMSKYDSTLSARTLLNIYVSLNPDTRLALLRVARSLPWTSTITTMLATPSTSLQKL